MGKSNCRLTQAPNYAYLRMLAYLEDAAYGVIERTRQIDLHEEGHRDE